MGRRYSLNRVEPLYTEFLVGVIGTKTHAARLIEVKEPTFHRFLATKLMPAEIETRAEQKLSDLGYDTVAIREQGELRKAERKPEQEAPRLQEIVQVRDKHLLVAKVEDRHLTAVLTLLDALGADYKDFGT